MIRYQEGEILKILIVDDEIVSRMKLQKVLENISECTTVESGEDALKRK